METGIGTAAGKYVPRELSLPTSPNPPPICCQIIWIGGGDRVLEPPLLAEMTLESQESRV